MPHFREYEDTDSIITPFRVVITVIVFFLIVAFAARCNGTGERSTQRETAEIREFTVDVEVCRSGSLVAVRGDYLPRLTRHCNDALRRYKRMSEMDSMAESNRVIFDKYAKIFLEEAYPAYIKNVGG